MVLPGRQRGITFRRSSLKWQCYYSTFFTTSCIFLENTFEYIHITSCTASDRTSLTRALKKFEYSMWLFHAAWNKESNEYLEKRLFWREPEYCSRIWSYWKRFILGTTPSHLIATRQYFWGGWDSPPDITQTTPLSFPGRFFYGGHCTSTSTSTVQYRSGLELL